MAKSLPARPNLDHLRRQAKVLLADLERGDTAAIRTFGEFLPEARKLTPAKIRSAGFRLADAQSVVARKTGFEKWPDLAKYVQTLRALEGEWTFALLQVDGRDMPAGTFSSSRLLIDGDRFRMESPEANYDGVFTVDVAHTPMTIDIEFVEGPEVGNSSYGIFELRGDDLTICLGLVGSSRPEKFATKPGTGHALEKLRRSSSARPTSVTGGKSSVLARERKPEPSVDATHFDAPLTPSHLRLQGEWVTTRLNREGEEMRADWLPFGSRTATGNEMKITFGGQVMTHAKVRIDENASPMTIDYLHLAGGAKGKIGLGIMAWDGGEATFLIAAPGLPRPTKFDQTGKGLTLSRWRRK